MKDNFISTIPQHLIPYQLPKNWKWFYWSDLMTNFQQGMIRSISQLGNGNSEYLKMGDLHANGHANFSRLAKTEASQKEMNEFSLKEGDFLINVRNSKELVGKTCVIEDIQNRIVLFNHMLVRIEHANIEMNYFVNAFLNIPSTKKMIDRIKQGTTTVIALYQRDLNNLPIALPDNLTFYQIVKLYKDINSKIELNNRINTELEAMAKKLYEYWFVQFDFPDTNGNPYKTSGGKMVWNEELKREIPDGWEVKTLSSILDCNKWTVKKEDSYSLINYLDTSNLTNNMIEKVHQINCKTEKVPSRAQRVISKNDILYSTVRPNQCHFGIIKHPISNMIGSTGFSQFRSKVSSISNDLIYTYLSTKDVITRLQQIADTSVSAYPSILPNDILGLKIVVSKDNDNLKYFNTSLDNIYTKISLKLKENQELASLRDWLLPMLMNGQVRVSDQEGNISAAKMQVLKMIEKFSNYSENETFLGEVAEESARYGK